MSSAPQTIACAISVDVSDVALEVLKAACARNLRVATAESCTGGLLAALLTDIEGCSHAFERGYVCYTDEAKVEMLGVDAALIERVSAVSAEVAGEMACGALAASNADIALSITGYTDESGDGEAGLVFFGVAAHGWPVRVEERRFGSIGRGAVRTGCLSTALMLIRSRLIACQ